MLAVAACALLLTGCAQPSPVVTPHTTSTVKPLFASDADALAAATKAYAAYLKIADQIFMDGGVNADRLTTVETGEQLKADLRGFASVEKDGIHSSGGTTFDQVKLQQNDADAVVVYVCEDVSGVDVIDHEGKSLVRNDRPNRVLYEATFDGSAGANTGLLLSLKRPWGDKSC